MKGEEQTHDGCCYTAIVSDDDMVNVKRKPSCGDEPRHGTNTKMHNRKLEAIFNR